MDEFQNIYIAHIIMKTYDVMSYQSSMMNNNKYFLNQIKARKTK